MVKKKKPEIEPDAATTRKTPATKTKTDAIPTDHPIHTLAERIEELRRARERGHGADPDPARCGDDTCSPKVLDVNAVGDGELHEFPPIGMKVVGPRSEWEALPGDVLRHRPLPFDPTRKWQIVPSGWNP